LPYPRVVFGLLNIIPRTFPSSSSSVPWRSRLNNVFNTFLQSLEQAIKQADPRRDPVTANALSKIIDFWYAVRGCSNMGPGSFGSCTNEIVASVNKIFEDFINQYLKPAGGPAHLAHTGLNGTQTFQ
jgi:hypothetical protein